MYDTFWNYFIQTWIVDYDAKFRNINVFTNDTDRLINRQIIQWNDMSNILMEPD